MQLRHEAGAGDRPLGGGVTIGDQAGHDITQRVGISLHDRHLSPRQTTHPVAHGVTDV